MTKMIDQETINEMRKWKEEGKSLREISEHFHVSKSTVSLHCRDLYSNKRRQYSTGKEARHAAVAKRKGKPRKRYPCANDCGNTVSEKGRSCQSCYRAKVKQEQRAVHKPRVTQRKLPENTYITPKGEEETIKHERRTKIVGPVQCPDSPIGSHHWIIKPGNMGVCKYCHESRQFGYALRQKVHGAVS